MTNEHQGVAGVSSQTKTSNKPPSDGQVNLGYAHAVRLYVPKQLEMYLNILFRYSACSKDLLTFLPWKKATSQYAFLLSVYLSPKVIMLPYLGNKNFLGGEYSALRSILTFPMISTLLNFLAIYLRLVVKCPSAIKESSEFTTK